MQFVLDTSRRRCVATGNNRWRVRSHVGRRNGIGVEAHGSHSSFHGKHTTRTEICSACSIPDTRPGLTAIRSVFSGTTIRCVNGCSRAKSLSYLDRKLYKKRYELQSITYEESYYSNHCGQSMQFRKAVSQLPKSSLETHINSPLVVRNSKFRRS